jgi:DNA-binding GntR family transcriptional regulator
MDAITTPLVQEQAYAHIKEAIISLRLKPGERIRTDYLAKSIDMSRTPVREALGRLEQEGLVRRDQGWGYVVHAMTVNEILNLFNVRELLEVEAALEAIPNLTTEELHRLSGINREAERFYREGRFHDFLTQNRIFYIALTNLANNQLLQQMLGMIHDRVRWIGSMIIHKYRDRAHELLLENREVLKALRSKKTDVIEAAIRAHIRRGKDHVTSLLHNLNISAIQS